MGCCQAEADRVRPKRRHSSALMPRDCLSGTTLGPKLHWPTPASVNTSRLVVASRPYVNRHHSSPLNSTLLIASKLATRTERVPKDASSGARQSGWRLRRRSRVNPGSSTTARVGSASSMNASGGSALQHGFAASCTDVSRFWFNPNSGD